MRTYWKIYSRQPFYVEDPDDYAEICFRNKLIAVGWSDTGDLNQFHSRHQLESKLARVYHLRKSNHRRKLSSYVSSLWSFRSEMKRGDIVLCPSKGSKYIYIGKIVSPNPYFDDTILENKCNFAHRRRVKWSTRILNHKDVLSVWPNGRFGGQQTVSQINTNMQQLQKLLKHKLFHRIKASGRSPFLPDKEWGREAELRAMKWLTKKGLSPIDVSKLNKGWDIECGHLYFEVKGRKSSNTTVRLTENEWRSAVKHKNQYTLLIFTAKSKSELQLSFPKQIVNPSVTESWNKRISYEYFLSE